MKKNFTAKEAFDDLTARWAALVDRIDRDKPYWHPSSQASAYALHCYLSGARRILGTSIGEVIEAMAAEQDPLLIRLVRRIPDHELHHVVKTLIRHWNDVHE